MVVGSFSRWWKWRECALWSDLCENTQGGLGHLQTVLGAIESNHEPMMGGREELCSHVCGFESETTPESPCPRYCCGHHRTCRGQDPAGRGRPLVLASQHNHISGSLASCFLLPGLALSEESTGIFTPQRDASYSALSCHHERQRSP